MNSKSFIVVVILLLWIQMTLPAQVRKTNSIRFHWGGNYLSSQDLIHSPFIHSDFSFDNLIIGYQREKKAHQFIELGIAGYYTSLVQPYRFIYADHDHFTFHNSFLHLNLTYGVGKRFDPNRIIGGAFNIDLYAVDYYYGIESSFGYLFNGSFDVWFKREFQFNKKHNISGSVRAPLISWYARSPYLVNDDEFINNKSSHNSLKTLTAFIGDGKLVTWNKLQRANFVVEYEYPVSTRWFLGARYHTSFLHSKEPRPIVNYQNNINLTTGIKL